MKKINRKLFVKETGEEFNIKDYHVLIEECSLLHPFMYTLTHLSESLVQELIDSGYLVEKLVEEPTNPKGGNKEQRDSTLFNIGIITHMADRLEWHPIEVVGMLKDLFEVNPAAVYSTLLKEAALMFDRVHKTPISKSAEIWIINSFNNKVEKVNNPKNIVSFDGFAAFRNKEEAIAGQDIADTVSKLIKEYYELLFQ